MRISEIITSPGRDEYLENKEMYFVDAIHIANIRELKLFKSAGGESIHYGLYNSKSQIVGYLGLVQYDDKWQVMLVQIAQAYKSQGYGIFLYDYAIMNDNLTVLSDVNQSENGPGGSKGLWEKLYRHGRYKVCGYDLTTDTVLPDATPQDVYNQRDDICWIAFPPGKTINETILYQNQKFKRPIVWYGPSIVPDGEF